MKKSKEKIVTSGIWYYDKTVPKKIVVYTVPAEYSCTRYNEDDELVETLPIPKTADGLVYKTSCGGEEYTLDEIKAWADSQPWGPCNWD